MQIDPLGGSLGARVSGVDLRDWSADLGDRLRVELLTYKVLQISGSILNPDQLLRVAEGFGRPLVHPVVPHLEGHPGVIEIRNFGKAHTLNEHWHSDVSFEPEPPDFTLLHAQRVPKCGGDTLFANQVQAFEELSMGMKAALGRLRAVHSGAGLARIMGKDDVPEVVHPVVRLHPETGEKALYICRAFSQRFEEMTVPESAPLLEYLYAWAVRPHLTIRVKWRPGDLVIWDNRSVQHYAVHDHGDMERVLFRVTTAGSRPVGEALG
ncbi:TauD/TfdA family dioxygenase [Myxococcota bacterium]|nr:TauD/TfdA family dioxygenase [Myxococcota bacterium]